MSKSASALNGSCGPDGGSLVPARSVARTIYDGCARLKDFPDLGRASRRLTGRRELTFAPLSYIVVYQVKPNAIEISRIFHGAQNWP